MAKHLTHEIDPHFEPPRQEIGSAETLLERAGKIDKLLNGLIEYILNTEESLTELRDAMNALPQDGTDEDREALRSFEQILEGKRRALQAEYNRLEQEMVDAQAHATELYNYSPPGGVMPQA